MPSILIVLICAVAIIGTGWRINKKRISERKGRFRDRQRIQLDLVFERFYKGRGLDSEKVKNALRTVGQLLGIDPELLLPSDTFDNELGPVKGYFIEDEKVDLMEWVRKETAATNIGLPKKGINTLEDLVVLLCQEGKVEQHN